MATYSSFAELQALRASSTGNQLQYKDRVIFEHEGYKIEGLVLDIGLSYENSFIRIQTEIFKLLGLDPWKFCEQHYMELPSYWENCKFNFPDFWPPYCKNDFESVTKVVLELFAKIEKIEELAETSEILFID